MLNVIKTAVNVLWLALWLSYFVNSIYQAVCIERFKFLVWIFRGSVISWYS